MTTYFWAIQFLNITNSLILLSPNSIFKDYMQTQLLRNLFTSLKQGKKRVMLL